MMESMSSITTGKGKRRKDRGDGLEPMGSYSPTFENRHRFPLEGLGRLSGGPFQKRIEVTMMKDGINLRRQLF